MPCILIIIFSLADIQSTSSWSQIGSVQDQTLKRLAESLISTVLQSKAESTTKKYLYAINRWRKWARENEEISEFPVLDHQFALYLQHVGQDVGSSSAVDEAVNAI